MDKLLMYLKLPPLQIALLMLPMIWAHNGPLLHRVMSDEFRPFVRWSGVVMLVAAMVVAAFHPLGIAMGAAVLFPHLQWIMTFGLYRRFVRTHGRPPRTFEERREPDSSYADFGFRVATLLAVAVLPMLIFGLLHWIVTDGYRRL